MASFTIIASNGRLLPLDSLEEVFLYNGDFLESITVEYDGLTYVQTFINDGTNITEISQWVVQ